MNTHAPSAITWPPGITTPSTFAVGTAAAAAFATPDAESSGTPTGTWRGIFSGGAAASGTAVTAAAVPTEAAAAIAAGGANGGAAAAGC